MANQGVDNPALDELAATIRELEVSASSADPEGQALLLRQIVGLREAAELLRAAGPAIAAITAQRPALTPAMAAFFRPQPAAAVPAWLPDTTRRSEVTAESMRCPAGAEVYEDMRSVSCAIPGRPGASLSGLHGLSLHFTAEGRLQSQGFYEDNMLRWSISYHASGGRDCVGFYASTSAKTYVEQGLHTRYGPGGGVVAQGEWVDGRRHGWHKYWEEDGFPIGATRYVDGGEVEQVHAYGQ